MLRCLLLASLALAPAASFAAELSGIVTEVHDGDTITLANWQHTYRIRLLDIDAPEMSQPRGRDSRAALFHLCALKQAVVETQGEDRFGRTLGRVTCAGVDANAEQVRAGWAWVFPRYAPKDSPLYAIEREARLEKRGLWTDDAPVAPWEWRRKVGNKKTPQIER
ncbi:MAG: thermonuclease family protein [Proteobacteria bacterium]|nr:thermonuclease family protein [Pseudomonadota bacterium]